MLDVSTATIVQIAPEIEHRRLSPVELVDEALARADALEPQLHAFITLRHEQARADAKVAEAEIRSGRYRGPLHGIPLSLKDNLAVAGWPTTNGSSLAADWVTDYDAAVAERLRASGAILIGKNNMHEWALGGTSWGGHFGSVQNPWAPGCIAGGSSGGSAAAVAASLAFASVGTDGMGSIRIPAALCGVVGLKPTFGLVSRFGELPPTSSQMDHVGPITKDVLDAALMLDALAGPDDRDPASRSPAIPRSFRDGIDEGIQGLRVGVPENYFFDGLDPEVDAAARRSVEALGNLGATLLPVRIPTAELAYRAFALMPPETLSFHRRFLVDRRDGYADREIGRRLVALQFMLTRHTQLATQARNLVRREFASVMQVVDVLVAPTVPVPTYPGDASVVATSAGGVPLSRPLGQHRLLTQLTVPFNFTGMPTISVPCGFTTDRLPIGLQIAGRRGEDATVLRTAFAFERATTGGFQMPPPVPVLSRAG